MSLGARATSGPINMIVTNVPGPQMPLYLMGAELLEMYPQVPLLANTGLGIALVSYNGKMFWGFNCDPDLVPDEAQFVEEIQAAFKALRKASSLRPAPAVRAIAGAAAALADPPPPIAALAGRATATSAAQGGGAAATKRSSPRKRATKHRAAPKTQKKSRARKSR
jgi:hypothetical protein